MSHAGLSENLKLGRVVLSVAIALALAPRVAPAPHLALLAR